MKNENIHFARIDADIQAALKEDSQVDEETRKADEEKITGIVRKALGDDKLQVKLETLKDAQTASMLTVDEQNRRMMDMMKMYASSGMGFGGMGMEKEGQTLILNAAHPLVKKLLSEETGEKTDLICSQLYDLARIQNGPLSADEMTAFIRRSNEILLTI